MSSVIDERCSDRSITFDLPSELPVRALPRVQRSCAFRWRGVIGGAITIVGGLVVLFTLNPEPRTGTWSDVAIDGLAWTVFLVGGLVRFWATLYIGARKGHTLIDDGPYSVCRHPLYVGTFLVAIAVALFLHSIAFTVLLGVVIAYYLRFTIPGEEAELRARLGGPHVEYCRRVPLLWPRWSLFRTSDVIPVSALAPGASAAGPRVGCGCRFSATL